MQHQGKRLVLRCDGATQRKERHRRADKLQRLQTLVAERNTFVEQSPRANPASGPKRLQQWTRPYKLSGFVELKLVERTIHLHMDEVAKHEVELLDGCYCIETDVQAAQLSAQNVHDRYKDLQQVERNFRRLKTDFLEVRPIFVRKAERTRAHAFIAMLGLKFVRLMEQRLRDTFGTTDTNSKAETVDSALGALARLCLQHYRVGDQEVTGLPRPDTRQKSLLSALNVKLTPP